MRGRGLIEAGVVVCPLRGGQLSRWCGDGANVQGQDAVSCGQLVVCCGIPVLPPAAEGGMEGVASGQSQSCCMHACSHGALHMQLVATRTARNMALRVVVPVLVDEAFVVVRGAGLFRGLARQRHRVGWCFAFTLSSTQTERAAGAAQHRHFEDLRVWSWECLFLKIAD